MRAFVVLSSVGLATPALSASIKDNLYGVKALSASNAVAVGNFGSVYRTVNGGKTWDYTASGVSEPLFSVDFADANTGWAVGKSATIVGTTDGGASWKVQKTAIPPEKHLFKVAAVDARTAWAVGDWGAITVTRNGGAAWEDKSLGVISVKVEMQHGRKTNVLSEDIILYDVQFLDAQHGMIVGEFGTLLVTADGGQSWEKRETGTEKTLFGVGFTSPSEGWAVGMDGLVIRTRDGGVTWQRQHGRAEDEALEDVGFMETLKNPGLYAVRVVGKTGIVVGDTGVLLTSNDAGETWSQVELPAEQRMTWMRDVSLAPGGEGFVVGASGFMAQLSQGKLRVPQNDAAATTTN